MYHRHPCFRDCTQQLRASFPSSSTFLDSHKSPTATSSIQLDIKPFQVLWDKLNSASNAAQVALFTRQIKSLYQSHDPHPLLDGVISCLTERASLTSRKFLSSNTKPFISSSHSLKPDQFDTIRKRLVQYDEDSKCDSTAQQSQLVSHQVAVARDVSSLSTDVSHLETMVRDVVMLNQFIAEQVDKQFQDVVMIQRDVREAVNNVDSGVDILYKSLSLLKKTKKIPFFILVGASVLLLLMDRINP
ncbi:hypothetical protein P9112_002509 [Eukaryota sp. TZLM1-RC]